tara:strand:- start:1304 stop:2830 length:1527 start_codon:yes stop_codon:yes gene_type:complete
MQKLAKHIETLKYIQSLKLSKKTQAPLTTLKENLIKIQTKLKDEYQKSIDEYDNLFLVTPLPKKLPKKQRGSTEESTKETLLETIDRMKMSGQFNMSVQSIDGMQETLRGTLYNTNIDVSMQKSMKKYYDSMHKAETHDLLPEVQLSEVHVRVQGARSDPNVLSFGTLKEAVDCVHKHDRLTTIVVGKGEHKIDGDFGSNTLKISSAMTIIGADHKDPPVIKGGIMFKKGIVGNCDLQNLILIGSKNEGVYGQSSFTMENVLVQDCGANGVRVVGPGVIGRCTDVKVTRCTLNGMIVLGGASITLSGTTIVENNCTGNKINTYGVKLGQIATVTLVSPKQWVWGQRANIKTKAKAKFSFNNNTTQNIQQNWGLLKKKNEDDIGLATRMNTIDDQIKVIKDEDDILLTNLNRSLKVLMKNSKKTPSRTDVVDFARTKYMFDKTIKDRKMGFLNDWMQPAKNILQNIMLQLVKYWTRMIPNNKKKEKLKILSKIYGGRKKRGRGQLRLRL